MADRNQLNVQDWVTLSLSEMEHAEGGAQVDYFLKLPGVDGESTDARAAVAHVKVIDGSRLF